MVASLPAFASRIPFPRSYPYPWVGLLLALPVSPCLLLARLYRRAGVPRAWWPTGTGWVGHALSHPTLGALAAGTRPQTRWMDISGPHPGRGVSNITDIKHHCPVSLRFCAERRRLHQRAGWYATLGCECERGWVLMRARAAARACGHGTRGVAELVKK
jgi:hypothetical protein